MISAGTSSVQQTRDLVQAIRCVLVDAFQDKQFVTPHLKELFFSDEVDDIVDRLVYLMHAVPDLLDRSYGLIRLIRYLNLADVAEEYQPRIVALWTWHPTIASYIARGRSADQVAVGIWSTTFRRCQGTHDQTDMGLTARLVDRFGADIARSTELGWFGWDGTRWANGEEKIVVDPYTKRIALMLAHETAAIAATSPNEMFPDEQDEKKAEKDRDKAAARAHAFAMAAQSNAKIKATRELAVSESGITVPGEAWDADPAILACPNGTLELSDTVTLRPSRRIDRCTRVTAHPYEPDAEGTQWTAFIERALPDPEVRAFFQQLCGYALYGDNPERFMAFLVGETSTGKSTVLGVIRRVLGDYAGTFKMSALRDKETDAPRPDQVKLIPTRFAVANETSNRWLLHADEVKKCTGGDDEMSARGMKKDVYLERAAAFLAFIGTNVPPKILGADQALWRRLLVIPFNQQIPKDQEEEGFAKRIAEEEGQAVLAWLTRGWELYRKQKLRDIPTPCAEAAMVFRESLSELDRWLADETEQAAEYETPVNILWEHWKAWCATNGVDDKIRGSSTSFGTDLEGKGFAGTRTYVDTPNGRRRIRTRKGLRPANTHADA